MSNENYEEPAPTRVEEDGAGAGEPPAWPSVRGQVAVVTGAGRGIGAAIAKELAAAGATVAIADIDDAAARSTAAAIERSKTTFVRAVDIVDEGQVEELMAHVVDRFGRIDLLVNNAGVAVVAPLLPASLAVWRRTFAVNVEGAMLASCAAATVMLGQPQLEQTGCRGKIVNVSSPAAEVGRPLLPAYGASKAALNHLSKSAAASWGDQGIATTIVYPGNVNDAMWPRLGNDLAAAEGRTAEAIVAERIAASPMGRFQEPAEVARAVMFVANFRGDGLNGRVVWSEPHVSVA